MKTFERRRFYRLSVSRPLKLQCQQTGRYHAGRSRNISDGGMLVEIANPNLLVSGQRIRVSRPVESVHGLIQGEQLLWATVVRSTALDRGQLVGLCFDEVQSMVGGMPRRAA